MGYAQEYATAIVNRGRVPMEPVGFVPDWTDRPRKWKHYPGAESLPLPGEAPPGTAERGLFGPADDQPFTIGLLGGMLRDSYGLLGRRLAISANPDVRSLPAYTHANWHRGAASGGGLYPVSIYLVSGADGPVLPGVRYYSPAHHTLRTLVTGDATAEVRSALGDLDDCPASDSYVLLGVKYWQNAFKYNSFCFHAVSMDVGAVLQTMRCWARAAGRRFEPQWWFDEPILARLLRVDDGEGIFAVIPLRGRHSPAVPPARTDGRTPIVRRVESERSRRPATFKAVQRMHAATRQLAPGRPDFTRLPGAAVTAPGGQAHPLPAPLPLDMPLRTALRRRHSSFGRFEASSPLPQAELATLLAATERAAQDTLPLPGGARAAGLYVFVNHVAGLEPGVYAYAQGVLHLVDRGAPGRFLQDNYFLANYNLEQAAAVVVPTVRTAAVLEAVGDRGYRLVNATIGAAAQAWYTAAAALGIGCGVALGFDSVSYVERLDLSSSGEVPLLLMMVGHERPGSAAFRYEIA